MSERWIVFAYLASFRMGARVTMAGRSDMVSKFVIYAVLLIMFNSIYRMMPLDRIRSPNITASNLLWYFAMTEIVIVGAQGLRRELGRSIAAGQFTTLMQRPGSFVLLIMARLFGGYLVNTFFLLTVACIVLPLAGLPMPMPVSRMPLMVVMLASAGVISLLLGHATGFFEIFGPYSQQIDWIVHKFMMALGGLFFPVSLFPTLMQKLVFFTPFPAILYEPARLMLGESDRTAFEGLGIQMLWVCLLGALAFAMEHFATQRVLRVGD